MELLEYIQTHPEEQEWGWCWLSANRHITLEMIDSFPHFPWRVQGLVINPNLTYARLKQLPDYQKYWGSFLQFGLYTLDEIKAEPLSPQLAGFIQRAAKNRHFSLAQLLADPDIIWSRDALSDHPELTIDHVINPPKNTQGQWGMQDLGGQGSISLSDIVAHPEVGWWWANLGCNPTISFQFILDHPELGIGHGPVSWNPSITPEIVRNNPGYSWHWPFLLLNPKFSLDPLLERMPTLVHSYQLYKHPELTLSKILARPDLPWKWGNIVEYLGSSPEYLAFADRRRRLLQAVQQATQTPASYFYYLPPDMFSHYLNLYLGQWRFSWPSV